MCQQMARRPCASTMTAASARTTNFNFRGVPGVGSAAQMCWLAASYLFWGVRPGERAGCGRPASHPAWGTDFSPFIVAPASPLAWGLLIFVATTS